MVNKDNAEDRILKKFKHTNDRKKEPLATQNQIRIETWRQRRYIAYRKQPTTGNLKKLRDHQKTRESIDRKES